MAQKKDRLPTLQIPVQPEFKNDVEDLALSFGYKQVSDFLLPVIQEYVECNLDRLNRYREFIKTPANKPNWTKNDAPKKKSGTKKKKPTAKIETPDAAPDESVGGDNAEN